MSNMKSTANKLSPDESAMDISIQPLSSAISAHSLIKGTPRDIRDWLMSLAEDFHASLFQRQGGGSERQTPAICGLKPSNVLTSYDHATRCWRTSQLSLLQDTSEEFSGTWPKSGLMLGGDVYPRPPLERRISAGGCGLWLTPRANESSEKSDTFVKRMGDRSSTCHSSLSAQVKAMQFATPRANDAKNSTYHIQPGSGKKTLTLSGQVQMFPTPTKEDFRWRVPNSNQQGLPEYVNNYPTPRHSDHKSGRVSEETLRRNSRPLCEVVANFATPQSRDYRSCESDRWKNTNRSRNLNDQVSYMTLQESEEAIRCSVEKLNPDWTEWLMGWPVGWTSLDLMQRENWDAWIDGTTTGNWWLEEPDGIPRVASGVSNRVARIQALGNGQVPLCASMAWLLLADGLE